MINRKQANPAFLRSPPTQVKRERSPSPPFLEKSLVTSGTRRFTPIPDNCLPSCAEYKRNRSEWVARCVKELEGLDLIPERRLLRDDGLAIDWKSNVPVWSDTLKPEPQDLAATTMLAHGSNVQRHHSPSITTVSPPSSLVSDAEPPLKKRLPVPPWPPSGRRLNNIPQSVPINAIPTEPGFPTPYLKRTRPPDETERESRSLSRDRIPFLSDQVSRPSDTSAKTYDRPVIPGTSGAVEEMSEMALTYLRCYVQTYESDRAGLAPAYRRNASFAYRVHNIVQNISEGSSFAWVASPQCISSGNKRTRLDIAAALLTLPSLHSDGVAQIEYDMFYLGARDGMFMVGRVVDSTKTVVHNFILQREVDVVNAGVWPLAAAAHQILVFQT